MKSTHNRAKVWIVLMLLLTVLVGCKGDSPSAPPPGSNPNPPGGGGGPTTPAGIVVTLETSDTSPLTNTTSVIRATVTDNGTAVPNGTAVEFTTTFGTFTESGTASVIRTTTGGVATATLNSPAAGAATVTVRVNNALSTSVVSFRAPLPPVPPVPPVSTAVTITSINPATGRVAGGEVITITGTNFEAPVRVLFGTVEVQVLSVTSTEIRVLTPPITLGPSSPTRDVPITVISRAGTTSEQRVVSGTLFRFALDILTPNIITVSPASGPNEGSTRITIIGENFQPPVRVFFGTAGASGSPLTDQVELQVINVAFGQIIAVTPPALGLGAELANKQVTLRVLNVGSNKDAVLPLAFRYGPGIRINAVSATQGSIFGGTTVTIFGSGFDDPVAVTIGGVAAQPIRVSGTEIVAITGVPNLNGCADVTGPISVTNIEDAQTAVATGLTFTFRVPRPVVTGISPGTASPGSTIQVTVLNADPGVPRLQIGTATVTPTNATTVSTPGGPLTTFTLTVPTNITFATEACTTAGGAAGVRSVITSRDIIFTNLASTCTNTLTGGLSIADPDTTCRVAAAVAVDPANFDFGSQLLDAGPTGAQTFTVRNNGGSPLTVNTVSSSNTEFAVTGFTSGAILQGGGSTTFQVRFDPTVAGSRTATITVGSTAGTATVAATGTGTTAAGVAALNPSNADFGTQTLAAGATAAQTFTIQNTGGTAFTVNSVASSNSTEFPVSGFAGATTVNAGASTTFQVRFDPNVVGARTATVTVTTTAGNPTATVTGTGAP